MHDRKVLYLLLISFLIQKQSYPYYSKPISHKYNDSNPVIVLFKKEIEYENNNSIS